MTGVLGQDLRRDIATRSSMGDLPGNISRLCSKAA